jgi:multiple sugar transport system permease protein
MSAAPLRRTRKRGRRPFGRFVWLGLWLLFVLAPLYWMLVTSIKPSDDYLANPPVWFPSRPTINHYYAALFAYRGFTGLVNSLVISSAATLVSTALSNGRQTSVLLGAVAAFPAADRDGSARVPHLSQSWTA